MNGSTGGPTTDPGRASRRVRVGLVALGVLAASTLIPVATSAMAADPVAAPAQAQDWTGVSNRTACTATGGAHCLAIVNRSDRRILSWILKILNPQTNTYDSIGCLSVPGDNGSGTTFFPAVHLDEGQQFVLEGRRDRKGCLADMWAGQGFTMGGSDGDNYSFAGFTARNPDIP
ncbi:MAG TPA: hypothetical protein VI248_13795 [Kineosporiaceae bacterium]